MNGDAQGFVALSGWVALACLPATILWVYLARRYRRAASGLPYRARLRPHYLLGYALAGCAMLHAAVATMRGATQASGGLGITAATLALALIAAQILLGACLLDPGAFRAPLRAWHFRLMLLAGVLSLAHVILNAPVVGMPPI